MKWTQNENEILRDNYQLKKSDLIKLLPNRTAQAINIQASKLGLKKVHNEYVKSNLSILLDDNHETWYWIGFIMADGCIRNNRLIVTLSCKDVEHLKKLSKYLETNISSDINRNQCTISCQDKFYIPKIVDKFNFKKRKTYNPPNINFYNSEMFISFIIGFIDGDGQVAKQYKRQDSKISIHIHSSWMNTFNNWIKNLISIYGIEISLGKIKNDGYYQCNITNTQLLRNLKNHTKQYNLPVLERKWSIIDETYISKYEIANLRKRKTMDLYNKGLSVKEISQELDVSYGCISRIIRLAY